MLDTTQEPQKSKAWLRTGPVKLTAEQAAITLAECRYPGQTRDQTKAGASHISVLADHMRKGQWHEGDKLDFVNVLGRLYCLNGHHRLTAQASVGKPIVWSIWVHQAADMDAADSLYFQFDTTTRKRTTEQILGASGLAADIGVNNTTASALYRAVPLIMASMDTQAARVIAQAKVVDNRISWCRQFAEEAADFEALIAPADTKLKQRMQTQGCFSVAMLTLRYQRDRAAPFWSGLANNDGLRKGDPRHTLIRAMFASDAKYKGDGSSWWTASTAAAAWRSWFRGQSCQLLRPSHSSVIAVDGTPYKGSQA